MSSQLLRLLLASLNAIGFRVSPRSTYERGGELKEIHLPWFVVPQVDLLTDLISNHSGGSYSKFSIIFNASSISIFSQA